MNYEYFVYPIGGSVMQSLEETGEMLEEALNHPEMAAHVELGWELWQVNTLTDGSGGNNGVLLIFRKPKP